LPRCDNYESILLFFIINRCFYDHIGNIKLYIEKFYDNDLD